MKFSPNPMKSKGEPVKLSGGKHTSGKVGRHASPSGGAGKGLGPSIAKGYPMTGKAKTAKTGGPFAKADTAKTAKGRGSKKMSMKGPM